MASVRTAGADGTIRYGAAALAFVSQLAHLWVLPGQFAARPLTGTLILLAAICQGMLAAGLLLGPGRWTVRFGVLLNTSLVLAWAVSRFASFPLVFGFTRLPVEPANLAAAVVEMALVLLLVKIERTSKTRRSKHRVR